MLAFGASDPGSNPGGAIITMKEAKKSSKALRKYKEVVVLLTRAGDRQGLVFVQDLVNKCVDYFELMAILEQQRTPERRFKSNIDKLPQERLIAIERMRGTKHNAVIGQLDKVNDYLFKRYKRVSSGGIYYLDIDPRKLSKLSREEVAKWVVLLVTALYEEGIVRK